MFNPEIINADGSCVSIGNAYGCAVPLYISELYRSKKQQEAERSLRREELQ